MRKSFLGVLLFLLALSGCGGGGGNDSDILSNGLLGGRTGTVSLVQNGCAEYRPIPVNDIAFGHNISAQVIDNDRLNITFEDNDYVCNALNVDRFAGRFDASCGIQPLVGFLPNLECTQELVWSYSESTSGDPAAFADVVRTAYVRCTDGREVSFACPVEYRGIAFECLRGICPQ